MAAPKIILEVVATNHPHTPTPLIRADHPRAKIWAQWKGMGFFLRTGVKTGPQ